MSPINWSEPIELDDGTPLKVTGTGTYHADLLAAAPHPAFTNKRHGSARLHEGLVISNHKYHVRNRSKVEKINLDFRRGDEVRARPYSTAAVLVGTGTLVILELQDTRAVVVPRRASQTSVVDLKDLTFACHNQGAPFENITFDEDREFKDGYLSGLAIGMGMPNGGGFYQAGGPGGIKLNTSPGKCRHLEKHDELDRKRGKTWKEGWAAGQARAKKKKKLDFAKPLHTLERDGSHREVLHQVTPASGDTIVKIEGKDYPIDDYGSLGQGHYEFIVENIPMTDTNWRRGYILVGSTDTTVWETLTDASVSYHKSSTPGRFILEVEQTRARPGKAWTTVKTNGPVDPLPQIVRKRVAAVTRQGEVRPQGQFINGTDFILMGTFEGETLTKLEIE